MMLCMQPQVGSIEGGILAAQWSPEGELLAVVTTHGLLLLFNKVSSSEESISSK